MEETYVAHIRKAFEDADSHRSRLPTEVLALEGLSGLKTRHFLNNLLTLENARYLEVGTWKGSTVSSAMWGNHARIVCIDNWSERFGQGNPKSEFLQNFYQFKGDNKATFIESDCFQVDVKSLPMFNIYMYDGEHSKENQYKGLTHFLSCLDNTFILIVDDWNFPETRKGTRQAITDLRLQPIFEKEVYNMSHRYPHFDYEGWFNGIYVAVMKKTCQ